MKKIISPVVLSLLAFWFLSGLLNVDGFVATTLAQGEPLSSATETVYDDNPAFDPDVLFPTWGTKDSGVDQNFQLDVMDGVIGENHDKKKLWQYIPRFIDLFLKLVAPIVVGISIYVGVRFIYAGENEEQVSESKAYFKYLGIGIIIMMISYSLMKGVYFLLAT